MAAIDLVIIDPDRNRITQVEVGSEIVLPGLGVVRSRFEDASFYGASARRAIQWTTLVNQSLG